MSEVVTRDAIGAVSAEWSTPQTRTATLIADANLAQRRFDVSAGEIIYKPDTPSRSLYLLHGGEVRVMLFEPGHEDRKDRSVRLLEILGEGDWFGAPALTAGKTYGTQAVAAAKSNVSEVPVDRLLSALPQRPEIAVSLIRTLSGKLEAAYADAAQLVFANTDERLVGTLLSFSSSAAATQREKDVELRITHQELAQAIGAARETVSLALTNLRQKKLLRTGRNRLLFNRDALAEFSRQQQDKVDAVSEVSEAQQQ